MTSDSPRASCGSVRAATWARSSCRPRRGRPPRCRWRARRRHRGVMPSCQIRRPSGVSHSTVPTRSAEPSDSGNSPRTVPVPIGLDPDDLGPAGVLQRAGHDLRRAGRAGVDEDDQRQVRCERRRARPRASSRCRRRARSMNTRPLLRNWLATPSASLTYPPGLPRRSRTIRSAPAVRASPRAALRSSAAPVRELVEPDERGLRARDQRPRDRIDGHVGPDHARRRAPCPSRPVATVTRRSTRPRPDPADDLVDLVAGRRLAVDRDDLVADARGRPSRPGCP